MKDIKEGKKVRLTRDQVFKKTGELFDLRHHINLSSDLLDTPDFYWDRQDLESLFVQACSSLNISKRTKIINEKLNHCSELMMLVGNHLDDKHHIRLEWMIIILILVEVSHKFRAVKKFVFVNFFFVFFFCFFVFLETGYF